MTRERAFGWVSSLTLQVLALGALGLSPLLTYDALPEPQTATPPYRFVRVIEIPKAPRGAVREISRSKTPSVARAFGVFTAPGAIPDRVADEAAPSAEGEEGIAFGIPFGIPEPYGEPPSIEEPLSSPVRVGGKLIAPRKRHHLNPVYPPLAAAARVQGTVLLEATIDESGNVVDLRVLRSIPLLDAAAIEAVRQWRYEPTLLNGSQVPILMTVSVRFELGR